MHRSRKLALLLPAIALGGCAVGMVRVSAPERPPPSALPPLGQRVSFDVCLLPQSPQPTPEKLEASRRAAGAQLGEVLSRAGIPADLAEVPGTPVRFTVTRLPTETDHAWSVIVSFLTLSLIPGYMVERDTLELSLAWRDSSRTERHDHLRYPYAVKTFVWLPLVVHPDFFGGVNGGWESDRAKDAGKAGFDRAAARLASDVRARLDPAGGGAPPGDVAAVACPVGPAGPPANAPEPGRGEWESVPGT